MTGSSNDPRAFCECTRQGNAAAAPAKKGRGMAAFANLGGGGCQCNLTHHHQLIYEPILHHLDRPFKRFQGVLGAPAGEIALAPPLLRGDEERRRWEIPKSEAKTSDIDNLAFLACI